MRSKSMDVVELSTDERNVANSGGTTVKIRFNNSLILIVGRQKLSGKSLYFQASLKTCYKDHKSKFLEVNYSVSNEIFKRIISFIITGNIDLHNEIVFDCVSLANYLQIQKFNQPCLDYFTYQLSRANVDEQLELLKSSR